MPHREEISPSLREFGGRIQGLDADMLIFLRALWIRDYRDYPAFEIVLQLIEGQIALREILFEAGARSRW